MCKLLELFSGKSSVPVDKIVMSANKVADDFSTIGVSTDMEDSWYHFPQEPEIWAEWCYEARSECPPYSSNTETEQGFDCDDFAKCFAAHCREKGYSNAIWEVWGKMPQGRHAWDVFQCADCKYEIEPQTGEVWVFGSKPDWRIDRKL